jgi:hypothetical protein
MDNEKEILAEFSKSEIKNQNNISSDNESLYPLDENLRTIQAFNGDNESVHNLLNNLELVEDYKNKEFPKKNLHAIMYKNKNLKEIYMLLNKNIDQNNSRNKKHNNNNHINSKQSNPVKHEIKLFSNLNNINQFNNDNNKKISNSTNIKGKFFSVYREISKFGQSHRQTNSKSLESYLIKNNSQTKITPFNPSPIQIHHQSRNAKALLSQNKTDKKRNINLNNDFVNKTNSYFRTIRNNNKWINKEQSKQSSTFFKDKYDDIDNMMLSNVKKISYNKGITPSTKNCSINLGSASKKKSTFNFYSNDYYKNELNKFALRLHSNNNVSHVNNLSKGNLFQNTKHDTQETILSPFYRNKRINLYKKIKDEDMLI